MKPLRVLGVVTVLLATVTVPAAPAIRDLWPQLRGSALTRVATLPVALRGYAQARRDIAQNELQLLIFGGDSPSREYSDLMWQRHRVRLVVVGGRLTLGHQRARWLGYNLVMIREVERRFGADAFESASLEAQRRQQAASARPAQLQKR